MIMTARVKLSILNEKINHRERLSEKTRKGCDSLNSGTKAGEEGSKNPSRLEIGHKSNRMVLNQAALRLGVCLRETEDELVREMLAATAGYINCVNGANGDTPTNMSKADVNIAIRSLMDADAKTILENVEAMDKFGTAPIRDAFLMLSSTKMIGDFDNVAGFLSKSAYPDTSGTLPSEYGSISNFRIFVSSAGSYEDEASADGERVMNNFCLGMEAYACVSQNEYSSRYIYRDPMYSGPLALNATAGFKMAQVPVITNDLWLVNLRSTLS